MKNLLVLASAIFLSLTVVASAKTIQICEDRDGWPPFLFKTDKGKIDGYSYHVIKEVLKGKKFSVRFLPWKRCLSEVETGKKFNLILNASLNNERKSKYLYSKPYYELNSFYFYSKEAHPYGLRVKSSADLKLYKICGMNGYNYENVGVKKSDLAQVTTSFDSMTKMVASGRCDLFIEKNEIVNGILKNYKKKDRPNIIGAAIPDVGPQTFHMLFSKNEKGQKLHDFIQSRLDELKASGFLEMTLKKFQ